MKLKDLKQGMVGKVRNGEFITVANSGYFVTNVLLRFTLEEKYNEDLTHKENKQLDVMKVTYGDKVVCKRNESRWFVPEVREEYFYTNDFGRVSSTNNMQFSGDSDILNNIRVFKTEEEAEKRLEQQRATLSVERWIAENDVEVDLDNTNVYKCSVYYFVETKEFKVMSYSYYIYMPKQFILSSEEKAEQLIEEREKELKIMFGVENDSI